MMQYNRQWTIVKTLLDLLDLPVCSSGVGTVERIPLRGSDGLPAGHCGKSLVVACHIAGCPVQRLVRLGSVALALVPMQYVLWL
jgi:hypothetical protein